MFRNFTTICLVFLTVFATQVIAQEDVVPITTANAAQVSELARVNLGAAASQSMAFRADGQVLAIGSTEGLRLLDLESNELGDYLYTGSISDPVYSPDGSSVAGYTITCNPGNCNGTIIVVAAETGELLLSLEYQGFVDYVAFSPDSTRIAYGLSETSRVTDGINTGTALEPSTIHIVDMATGEDIQTVEEEHGILGKLFFNADGTRLAYNSMIYDTPNGSHSSGTLHIIDLESGEDTGQMAAGYLVTALNPDWTQAAISTNISLPGVFTFSSQPPFIADAATGETLTVLEDFSNYTFNPDWTLIAANKWDAELSASVPTLHDASTLEALTTFAIENLSNSFSYAFSRDGALIAMTFKVENDENFYLGLWGLPQM